MYFHHNQLIHETIEKGGEPQGKFIQEYTLMPIGTISKREMVG